MIPMIKVFNKTFAPMNVRLTDGAAKKRQRGYIEVDIFSVHYLFNVDEQGEYLEYYASQRIAGGDSHARINSDGTVESLDTPQEFMAFPADCSEEERARIQKQYYKENRRIYAELKRKGFK